MGRFLYVATLILSLLLACAADRCGWPGWVAYLCCGVTLLAIGYHVVRAHERDTR